MRKLIIMGIPTHGNLGDHVIAMAERKILEDNFKNYKIYEVPERYLDKCAKRVKNCVDDDDIIVLVGGGNIGDIYERPEKGRREVIKQFPNNKIILFPQTVYFSDTENGRKELEISKEIYNKHNNLVLLARENKTYNFMKEHFNRAKIYLTPDIVMTLKMKSNKKRDGALLMLRSDREKTLSNEAVEEIKKEALENYGQYTLSDMYVSTKGLYNIGGEYRDKLLKQKFDEFQTAKIVVTDRLHGMILAAITETPCIAFSNFNHKIDESYYWFRDLNYIKYCTNIDELKGYMKELKSIKEIKYDNSFAKNTILDILKQEIKENKEQCLS